MKVRVLHILSGSGIACIGDAYLEHGSYEAVLFPQVVEVV
jgi:hypothetical protein